MLTLVDLSVSIEGEPILDRFSLEVKPGEIHALMGPNGAGKSTLAKVLAGHPDYTVTHGKALFCGEDLFALPPEERARKGLFLGFQYPVEIPGVTNMEFLYHAYKMRAKERGEEIKERAEFRAQALKKMEDIGMSSSFLDRDVNSGFSGGEKKRNEILQMALLKPKLAILDETDSGLDVDAMRVVAAGVKREIGQDQGLVLITHYHRLLEYIRPDTVHVVIGGRIVKSGSVQLALELEKQGYDATVASAEGSCQL